MEKKLSDKLILHNKVYDNGVSNKRNIKNKKNLIIQILIQMATLFNRYKYSIEWTKI